MTTRRRPPSREFLMSTELELQTALPETPAMLDAALERFFDILWEVAPSVAGPSGVFNGYGRIYFDCGHVELAICECASPLDLPGLVERQQDVVRLAVERLERHGLRLWLANNNSNGLLLPDSPTWGSHENYLTERHARRFGRWILPFLVTRLFGGAGGIDSAAGAFVAGSRPTRIRVATGGGTTQDRAIHSTAREEHHMHGDARRYRYHLILGDGHRSHFNLALQFATTALALKAIFHVRELRAAIDRLAERLRGESWVTTLQRLNVLEKGGESWSVAPEVLETQRLYREGARRYAEMLDDPPEWIPWALDAWGQVLDALERRDLDWLSRRLDAFAKYRVYAAIVQGQGKSWNDLRRETELTHELALLDQSYHAFCRSDSLFTRLENAGLMRHRLRPRIGAGEEPEPFVPSTGTRADARARAIRRFGTAKANVLMDWSHMQHLDAMELRSLGDPFATEYVVTSRQRPPVPTSPV